ncbi:class A beta-lactamase-related serine hydrolase [Paenibacillaceae bacterium]|nr:class A beta-lactamase-related serine hydrolase [Paenibacillaceae bacterium]
MISRDQQDAAAIIQLFEQLQRKGLFSGCIAVAAAETADTSVRTVWSTVLGLKNYRTGARLGPDSLYELASVTKPFTATAIQLLQQQGKLHYEEPLVRWLPELPYPEITIAHALTHTSGLPDYMSLLEQHKQSGHIYTNSDVVQMLAKHRPAPQFAPGERCEYSNTGYVLLASIIEAVSGMPYADFMTKEVFQPCGMERSRVYNRRLRPEKLSDFASGWIRDDQGRYSLPDELPEMDYVIYLDGIQGDGTVHSTLQDLLAFDTALNTGKLLNPDSLYQASVPCKLTSGEDGPCGYGWFLAQSPSGRQLLSHSGGWPGYWTRLVRSPEEGRVLVLLANVETITGQQARSTLEKAEQIWFR